MKNLILFLVNFIVAYAFLGLLSTFFMTVKRTPEATVWDIIRIKFYIVLNFGWIPKAVLAAVYATVIGRYFYERAEDLE